MILCYHNKIRALISFFHCRYHNIRHPAIHRPAHSGNLRHSACRLRTHYKVGARSRPLTVAPLLSPEAWPDVAVRIAVCRKAFPGVSDGKACSDSGPEMVAQDLRKWLELMGSTSILSLLIPIGRCLDKRPFP